MDARDPRANLGGSIESLGCEFQPSRINDLERVSQMFASWNQIAAWLRQLDRLRAAG